MDQTLHELEFVANLCPVLDADPVLSQLLASGSRSILCGAHILTRGIVD
jgi:hypothetical protein